MKTKKQSGTTLILSIIILSLILVISLTASKIMVSETKMTSNTSDSIQAYQAADAGIEYALYRIKQGDDEISTIVANCPCPPEKPVGSNSSYCLEEIVGVGIKAIGKANKARRALEIEVEL